MEFAFRAIGVDVEAQSCGGVVDAIEEVDMILAEALLRGHGAKLLRKMPNPQLVILGCTHYLFLEEVFQSALGAKVKVFFQAALAADSLKDYSKRQSYMQGEGGVSKFISTGYPQQVSNRATHFLRRKIVFEAISTAFNLEIGDKYDT